MSLIDKATRTAKECSTLLDLFASNSPSNITLTNVIEASVSDYDMLIAVSKINACKLPPRTIECRNYAKYNPLVFCDDLRDILWDNVLKKRNVNTAWSIWKELCLNVCDQHAPYRWKVVHGVKYPWLTKAWFTYNHRRSHDHWNNSTDVRKLHFCIWSQLVIAISDKRVCDLPFSGNKMYLQSTKMHAKDAGLWIGVKILLLLSLLNGEFLLDQRTSVTSDWGKSLEREISMELSIHYLTSYDILIENTSTGESEDSCLHVYQACYLKFVQIVMQERRRVVVSLVLLHVLNLCCCCIT